MQLQIELSGFYLKGPSANIIHKGKLLSIVLLVKIAVYVIVVIRMCALNLQIYNQKPALLSEVIRRTDVHVNMQRCIVGSVGFCS